MEGCGESHSRLGTASTRAYDFPMRRSLPILLSALLVLAGAPAIATQDDARLDVLFARLQVTSDQVEAEAVEAKIWEIWTESGESEIDRTMARGIFAMQRGKYDNALGAFESIVHKLPRFAEGWNKRATVYYLMSRYQESLTDVRRTLDLEPRHFGALSGRGLIYMALGEDRSALAAFEDALAVNPHMSLIRARVKRLRMVFEGAPI